MTYRDNTSVDTYIVYFDGPGTPVFSEDLTAYTYDYYVAEAYMRQYSSSNPKIIKVPNTKITDPIIDGAVYDITHKSMDEEHDLINEYSIDPFCPSVYKRNYGAFPSEDDDMGIIRAKYPFYATDRQYEMLNNGFSDVLDEVIDGLMSGFYMMQRVSKYIRFDGLDEILGYIFMKYVRRLVLFQSFDLSELTNEQRYKLGLPQMDDTLFIDYDMIYNEPRILYQDLAAQTSNLLDCKQIALYTMAENGGDT